MRPRPRLLTWLARIACAAAVVWLAVTGFLVWAVRRDAQALAALAGQPAEQIKLEQLQHALQQTRKDSLALKAMAAPVLWLTPALGWVPFYGADLQAAGELLSLLGNLSGAGDDLLTVFLPLLPEAGASISFTDALGRLTASLPAARPRLEAAARAMDEAAAARERIHAETLTPGLRDKILQLDRILPWARSGAALARALPQLLALDGPQTYLLLAQNEDELRASGGFISGVGLATMDQGRITELQIEDAYAIDDLSRGANPAAPAAFTRYMGGNVWVMRDANWSPDFPLTAEAARALYRLGRGRETDGVIAFDQAAVRMILAGLGPVAVPDAPEPVTSDNVVSYMRQAWSATPEAGVNPDWYAARKDFMAKLARAMLEKLYATGDRTTLTALGRAALSALEQRHLLIFSTDARLASALADAGWDGGVRPGTQDYLMVVDTNLGFNKVNPLIVEELAYEVDLTDPAQPLATLNLRYAHTGQTTVPCRHEASYGTGQYSDLMQRCYWDYWRVLTPAGVSLLSAPLNDLPAAESITGHADFNPASVGPGDGGTTEIAGIFVLPVGTEKEIRLVYKLPVGVLAESADGSLTYRLHVQKQPGTAGLPVVITLRYPPVWTAGSALAPDVSAPGVWSFGAALETDLPVEIKFARGRAN